MMRVYLNTMISLIYFHANKKFNLKNLNFLTNIEKNNKKYNLITKKNNRSTNGKVT